MMKSKGFTLIESLLTIVIITVGIGRAYLAIHKTFTLTSGQASRFVAAFLVQEGIEIVRNIRDTNFLEEEDWRQGLGTGSREVDYTMNQATEPWLDRYLNIDDEGFYGYGGTPPTNPTKFKRKITITEIDDDTLEILSVVSWQETGVTKEFEAQEKLYNWK